MIEAAAQAEPYVFVNGGLRGLQVRLAPADVVRATNAIVTPLIA
jgi:Cys-tRNA(Pro)/Cys-tRNA(Cys) deacylase